MFERTMGNELKHWFNDPYKKPLILRGARQVGKTTVVKRFAAGFDNFLSVNLEKSTTKQLFESTDDIKKLLPLVFLYCNVVRREGKTLSFDVGAKRNYWIRNKRDSTAQKSICVCVRQSCSHRG
jgi:hypothetical protein